ncbi:MAG: S9 family peptidase [Candidatus Aminicenantes bacterium]|nr:MAG: S9 family peptidase [Candidatus Aminicenantes bacterium]RLE01708.1 MAG: S9 family peptidase [Candidatus Aminicenantes bacterium]
MKRNTRIYFSQSFLFKAFCLVFLLWLVSYAEIMAGAKRPLTFVDVMKFKAIRSAKIADNGEWLVYEVWPDRGDGEVVVQATNREVRYVIPRGEAALITSNGKWVVCRVQPPLLEREEAGEKGKTKLQPGMALLKTTTGKIQQWEKVKDFAFSKDGQWLLYQFFPEKKTPAKEEKKEEAETGKAQKSRKEKVSASLKRPQKETSLTLRHLATGQEFHFSRVISYALAPDSHFLAVVSRTSSGEGQNLVIYDLHKMASSPQAIAVWQKEGAEWSGLTWWSKGPRLAFLGREKVKNPEKLAESSSGVTSQKNVSNQANQEEMMTLYFWEGSTNHLVRCVSQQELQPGWVIPLKNSLRWSKDGQRLFFGTKFEIQTNLNRPATPRVLNDLGRDSSGGLSWVKNSSQESSASRAKDLYDLEEILKKREVDVWHWNDPYIIPHQKKLWPKIKDKTYTAVYHIDSGKYVQLADSTVPEVRLSDNSYAVLGISNLPYRKEVTWAGRFNDLYLITLQDGRKTKVAVKLADQFSLSPSGKMVVYFQKGDWYLYDIRSQKSRNLTHNLAVSFANEDHDYPREAPSYGLAGWLAKDEGVLIYDKYDIWFFPMEEGQKPLCLTGGQGREEKIIFRLIKTDPEKKFFHRGEKLLLSSYREMEKNFGFYEAQLIKAGVKRLLEEKKKFKFVALAKKAPVIIYTRESYEEFPDLWITDLEFRERRKLTEVNPQMKDFLWGKAELISWRSLDGLPLQGVLIKPGNYVPGQRYPVIVYFYRFFSQRLYEFNQPVVNHRPCFPLYTSNGYALFLPDIRFEVGRPGFSATKCLVPGVQKLIDLGIADPKAIGLHGHSWSGYQTAFVITQTNIFACAVAGAPVSNMTSAYSGIRWGSGLARQFQYEKTQSRIGGSLWEFPERYYLNSPVFFAEWIQTPLLIMFGDEDGAVPWYQGIELYLALRRLGKECVFLQYRGEPHHLQKYPNKLDYALKMKQFFDHYLKKLPAPEWLTRGVPYQGK